MTNYLGSIIKAINNNVTAMEAVIIGIILGSMVGMLITGNMAQRHIQSVRDRHMATYSECVTLPYDFDSVLVSTTVDVIGVPIITANKFVKECK